MYFTYCIHAKTLSLSVLKRYSSKKLALMNIKRDAEDFLEDYKGTRNLATIDNQDELINLPNGFYIKKSSMHQDRFNLYEKNTETVRGWIWNKYSPLIEKTLIFSVFEDPLGPKIDLSQADLFKKSLQSIQVIKQSLNDPEIDNRVQTELIKELKACLRNRRRVLSESIEL